MENSATLNISESMINGFYSPSVINHKSGARINIGEDFIQTNGTLNIELNTNSTPYINIGRDAHLDGDINITLAQFMAFTPEQDYILLNVDGETNGKFINYDEGDFVLSMAGYDYLFSYLGGDGNDIVLVPQSKGISTAISISINKT